MNAFAAPACGDPPESAQVLTAMVTATAAASGSQQRSAAWHNTYTISDTLAYATAEKQGIEISYRRGWVAAHEFTLAQVSASARRSKMTPVFASV